MDTNSGRRAPVKSRLMLVPFLTASLVGCSSVPPNVDREPHSVVGSQEHQEIVGRALAALYEDYKRSWSFTETSTAKGETKVATYDPRKSGSKRWTLVSVDGRPPTDKDRKTFRAQKLKQEQEVNRRDKAIGPRATVRIRPGTLKLRQKTDTHWIFDFIPAQEGDDDRIMRYVTGTMKIVKDGHYVESVVLRNDASITPLIGVKISTILVVQKFAPAKPAGPIVPISVDVQIKGRAFLVAGFNESEFVRFTEYRHVGD